MPDKKILSALVRNHPGVLQRVSGLFYRRGYNIETITACATEDPKFSRMTIAVLSDDDSVVSQIVRQLDKVDDVRRIAVLDSSNAILSESMLVKLECPPERRTELLSLTLKNHAHVVDIGDKTATITASGSPDDLDELLQNFGSYKVVELTRSGLSAMETGDLTFADMPEIEV